MAPLLPLPHNWIDAVEVTRAWPVSILAARDGSEQRRARSLGPTVTLRYLLTAESAPHAHRLVAALLAAGATAVSEADQADAASVRAALRVRVPRWEDAVRLTADASAAATSLSVDQDATLRAFADGAEVALWRPDRAVASVELAVSGAVAEDTLTLAAALGTAWAAGTVVAPVTDAWLDPAPELERHTGTLADAVLTLTVAVSTAGDDGEDDGAAVAPVVASLEVRAPAEGGIPLYAGQQKIVLVTCVDAAGVPVEPPEPLVWTIDDPAKVRLRLGNATGTLVYLEGRNDAVGSAIVDGTVTEPDSGVTAAFSVSHVVEATSPVDAP